MAARENQGYLIAVIILVLLTLILALSAFLGLSKASEHYDARKVDAKKLLFAEKLGDARAIQANIYVTLIGGHGPSIAEVQTQRDSLQNIATSQELATDEQQQIQAIAQNVTLVVNQFQDDMADSDSINDGDSAQKPTYREKNQNLASLVAVKNKDYNLQVNDAELAKNKAKDEIQIAENNLKTSQDARNKLADDLKAEKLRSLTNEEKLKNQVSLANNELDQSNKKYQRFQQTTSAELSGLKNTLSETETQNETLKLRINRLTQEDYDRPDGQIIKVASGLRSVFINLGREDGLTNNRTFSIYDQSVTNFNSSNHKATIEVTNVSDFGAQARITQEDPTNPILAGDFILTPTWDPGFAVKFALAGFFDLDGDGYDDSAKLARMIERNGGEVIVKTDSNGDIQGTMDSNIRYLVKGSAPPLGQSNYINIVNATRKLEEQAKQNTIEEMDLQKLLNRMGVRIRSKMKQIDRPIGGFPDTPNGGFKQRSSTDTLKSDDR